VRPYLSELESRRLLANLTVMNTNASGSGSLAAAIETANSNDQANTITFSQSAFGTPQTITLDGSALELSDTGGTQTITGPPAGVTISADRKSGVFDVDSGVTATISGLTISSGQDTNGGGVDNHGSLTLTGCTFYENSAGYGGAVLNSGSANLEDCTIWLGSGAGGAGVDNQNGARMFLTDCTVWGNNADFGGGAYNDGSLELTYCTISGNASGLDDGSDGRSYLLDTIVADNTFEDIEGAPVSQGSNSRS
jgi:fibronectin-binding autotransporter adhesin